MSKDVNGDFDLSVSIHACIKKKGGRGREWRLKLNLKSEAAYVSQGFSYQIACAECLWMIKIASQGEREREHVMES